MPKIIDKYCFLQIAGGEYILHTRQPFIIGRVWLYKDIQGLTAQMEKLNPLSVVKMTNYAIAVTLWAVLGDRLIIHNSSDEEIKSIMQGILNFYIETKITPDPDKYKRYLI